MLILSIRTDNPEAELCLFNDSMLVEKVIWLAHRELAETVHIKIGELLKLHSKQWDDIEGIVCYEGPGSFTGLRIGITVGNILAYSLAVPIIGTSGANWVQDGIGLLVNGKGKQSILPAYGSEAHITLPNK